MKKPLRFWRTLDMKFIIRGQLQALVLDLRMKQQVFILIFIAPIQAVS